MTARPFALEIQMDGAWVRCVENGREYRAASRSEAESEARFSLEEGEAWRVVEVLA